MDLTYDERSKLEDFFRERFKNVSLTSSKETFTPEIIVRDMSDILEDVLQARWEKEEETIEDAVRELKEKLKCR